MAAVLSRGREISQVDTSGLMSAVLQIVTLGASGAASAAGGSAAEALITALRERLGSTDDGRAALDAFMANPGDAASAAALRTILDREVATDPTFGQRLEALAWAAIVQPPQTTTSSVVIGGGAKVSRNQISLGPLTINNNRQGLLILALLTVALMTVVALAGYGVVQVITDEDSERPVPNPLPATQWTADAILPDRAAMEGTTYEGDPERGDPPEDLCRDSPVVCGEQVRASRYVAFSPYAGDGIAGDVVDDDTAEEHADPEESDVAESVIFFLFVHASEDDSERTFAAMREDFADDPSYDPSEQTHLGDEFASYADVNGGERGEIICLMRYGAYVSVFVQDQVVAGDGTETRRLNTLLLRRMSEAWSGDTPDTTLRDVQTD